MKYLLKLIKIDSRLVMSKLLRPFILVFGLGLAQPIFAEEEFSDEEQDYYVNLNLYQTFDAFRLATMNAQAPGSLLLESSDFQNAPVSAGSLLNLTNSYNGQKALNTSMNSGPGSPGDLNIPVNGQWGLMLLFGLGCCLFFRKVRLLKYN